jgi:hypothetical protein
MVLAPISDIIFYIPVRITSEAGQGRLNEDDNIPVPLPRNPILKERLISTTNIKSSGKVPEDRIKKEPQGAALQGKTGRKIRRNPMKEIV